MVSIFSCFRELQGPKLLLYDSFLLIRVLFSRRHHLFGEVHLLNILWVILITTHIISLLGESKALQKKSLFNMYCLFMVKSGFIGTNYLLGHLFGNQLHYFSLERTCILPMRKNLVTKKEKRRHRTFFLSKWA